MSVTMLCDVKILVVSTGDKNQLLLKFSGLLPIFIIEVNAKFS